MVVNLVATDPSSRFGTELVPRAFIYLISLVTAPYRQRDVLLDALRRFFGYHGGQRCVPTDSPRREIHANWCCRWAFGAPIPTRIAP